ncbi:MAG: sugar phosphate isomerase/epimerase [Archaeoglobi archaeon]|nr:sugar phosphate isomerase/epimerase [Archaeoglobi archaeon]
MILFSSMFLYEYPVEEIARACRLAGYDGIEFWIETPHYWIDIDYGKVESIKECVKSVHCAVLDLNPCSVNHEVAEVTLKTNLHAVSVAAKLGVSMTIHAGKRSAAREPVREDYEANERYFRILSRYARIKGTRLLLENSEPRINYLCRDFDEVLECAERFGFGITFDVNHALKNGDADSYVQALDLIENVHVSGYDERGRHVAARNNGKVRDVLVELRDAGYEGMVTVELDDLGYGYMDYGKKVDELRKEREFLEKIFRR